MQVSEKMTQAFLQKEAIRLGGMDKALEFYGISVIEAMRLPKGKSAGKAKRPSKTKEKDEVTSVALSSTQFSPEMAAKANNAGVKASTIRGVWDVERGFVPTRIQHHTKITDTVSMSVETAQRKRREQAGFGGRSGILCQDGKWRRAARKRGNNPVYLYWEWEDGEQPGQPVQENLRK